jgi:type I restriction enzyme S subunit
LTNYTNRFISRGERNITEAGLSKSSARMVHKNTILLASRAPIGYMAIASNDVCTNHGFKSIVVNPQNADYNFVYYLLQANMEYIKSFGTGTTFAEVSASVERNLKFKFPHYPPKPPSQKSSLPLTTKLNSTTKSTKS